jgi:hypothetical protein
MTFELEIYNGANVEICYQIQCFDHAKSVLYFSRTVQYSLRCSSEKPLQLEHTGLS